MGNGGSPVKLSKVTVAGDEDEVLARGEDEHLPVAGAVEPHLLCCQNGMLATPQR